MVENVLKNSNACVLGGGCFHWVASLVKYRHIIDPTQFNRVVEFELHFNEGT